MMQHWDMFKLCLTYQMPSEWIHRNEYQPTFQIHCLKAPMSLWVSKGRVSKVAPWCHPAHCLLVERSLAGIKCKHETTGLEYLKQMSLGRLHNAEWHLDFRVMTF